VLDESLHQSDGHRGGDPPAAPKPSWTPHELIRCRVADELNDRPRKRFAFATPTEQIADLLLQ